MSLTCTRVVISLAVALATSSTLARTAHAAGDGEGTDAAKAAHAPGTPPSATPARPKAPQGGTDAAKASVADTLQPTLPEPGTTDKAAGPWELTVFGYLRAGYDHTFKDERYAFIGRNNGFVLDSARIGLQGGNRDYALSFRISIEGASDVLSAPNTPIGTLAVRLRDGFARWDPFTFIGLQAGQFKAPFQEEELRGTQSLLFATRAVGVEGVSPGRGFQLPGIQQDRQLGVMVSPIKPIGDDINVSYYLMVMNGNGSNQLLDDNGRLGLVARTELNIFKYVRVGGAVFRNDRTVGTPPNLYNEEDLGLTGDVGVTVAGIEAFGAITRVRTTFPTVGTSARVQLAYHGQVGYRIDLPGFDLTPAYRYAYFHPWQSGGGGGFDAFKLQYHTFGVRAAHAKLPLTAWLNYTITGEAEGRKLANDRIEILGQVTF
jgi:hypothetical protein